MCTLIIIIVSPDAEFAQTENMQSAADFYKGYIVFFHLSK